MGAWGLLFDENDDAADWLDEFGDEPTWSSIDNALAAADADSVKAPEASAALAAAEVVAAGLNRPSARLDSEISAWAAQQPNEAEARRQKASAALVRIRDDSELGELWQESEEFSDWQTSVNETLARL
jgi:uncharacterized protein (DUF4415 family)